MRHLGFILILFVSGLLTACASTTTQPGQVVSASSGVQAQSSGAVSQKRDPSKIYGDPALNAAYEAWAAAGYPKHPDSRKYDLEGKASWYGPGLNGNHTANGEIYDMYGMSAAHKKLPFGTIVVVTNEENGKSVVVRINDRGPFIDGRIIDMSYGSAYLLDMIRAGVVPVRVDIISIGKK